MLTPVLSSRALFHLDYPLCRQAFLQAVDALADIPRQQHSYVLPPANNVTEPLTLATDVVWLGASSASKVLVIISGTHGVEGYAGSAIQRCLLEKLRTLPKDTAVLIVHSLNPWGMYWARRCDQQGVDLNRNFIDFDALPAPAPEYAAVLAALSNTDAGNRRQALADLSRQWGQDRFDQIFSGGQFQQAWAPFFGGEAPTFARAVIDDLIQRWTLADKQLVVIDLHTGLGPWSFGELISDHPAGSQGNQFARTLFGAAVAITATGGSFSVPKLGLLDYRWHQLMQQQGCFLTLEFGSYGTDALFDVLLAEHLFWHHRPPARLDDTDYQQQRISMLEHFCPQDKLWQQAVLFKSCQVIDRILEMFGER